MNKRFRLIKSKIATILVVLMCINSFAAVVGDNDGAAFITKAEFESLKNDFQTQINRYNTSLDSKIDVAIATYLAGISMKLETAKKPLISNYNDIWWFGCWKVYGNMKTFTGETTYTTITNKWFTPPADKRRYDRDNTLHMSDALASWGREPVYVYGTCEYPSDSLVARGSYVVETHAPILYLKVLTKGSKTYIDESNPWRQENNWRNFIWTVINTGSVISTDGSYSDTYWNRQWRPLDSGSNMSTETSGLAADTFAKFNAFWYYENKNKTFQTQHHLRASNTPLFSLNRERNVYGNTSLYNQITRAYYNGGSSARTQPNLTKLIANGVHAVVFHTANVNNQMKYMMFGTQINDVINVAQQNETFVKLGFNTPVYDDSEYTTLVWKPALIASAGPQGVWNDTTEPSRNASQAVSGVSVTLRVPLFPQRKIAQQNSTQFTYKNEYLKYGQGLPLIEDPGADGNLQMSFDYNIYNMLNTSATYETTQDLYLDVANHDFLTTPSNADYIYGHQGLVDLDKITDNTVIMKQYKYPNKTGHVDLTFDVKNGSNLWLRMRPSNVDGGYYARIKNLKLTYISNN